MIYLLIKDTEIVSTSDTPIKAEGLTTIPVEKTPENLEKIKLGYNVEFSEEGEIEFVESEASIEKKIQEINAEFDKTIDEHLAKYPKREQDTFAEKKREAEKVLDGGSSIYIEGKAEALGISPEDFANVIIAKNNEWTELYTQLENEKDAKILALKS